MCCPPISISLSWSKKSGKDLLNENSKIAPAWETLSDSIVPGIGIEIALLILSTASLTPAPSFPNASAILKSAIAFFCSLALLCVTSPSPVTSRFYSQGISAWRQASVAMMIYYLWCSIAEEFSMLKKKNCLSCWSVNPVCLDCSIEST